jgi:hypothetical protein
VVGALFGRTESPAALAAAKTLALGPGTAAGVFVADTSTDRPDDSTRPAGLAGTLRTVTAALGLRLRPAEPTAGPVARPAPWAACCAPLTACCAAPRRTPGRCVGVRAGGAGSSLSMSEQNIGERERERET